MLYIHQGRANTTWSNLLPLIKANFEGAVPLIILVPSHYTLQTEQHLMNDLQAQGFFDLDIFSPARLRRKVFNTVGSTTSKIIDEYGKAIAVENVLLACRRKLKHYTKAYKKSGFVYHMSQLLTNFKSCEITSDLLATYCDTLEGTEKDKYQDIVTIYRAYDAMLSGQFVDDGDVHNLFVEQVKVCDFIKESVFIMYGFDTVTQEMGHLLQSIVATCKDFHLFMVQDEKDEAFSPVTQSIERFIGTLQEARLPYQKSYLPTYIPPFAEISALERGLLNPKITPYLGPCGAIRLYVAPTPYAQAHFVAQEIIYNLRQGVALQDMKVFYLEESKYAKTLQAVLDSYEIPCFIASKMSGKAYGVASFVVAALRAIGTNFRQKEMLDLLDEGFLDLTDDECFQMKNYIMANGIKYAMFTKPFTRTVGVIEIPEDQRLRMMTPLVKLKEVFAKAKDTQAVLCGIIDLLTDVNAYAKHERDVFKMEKLAMYTRSVQQNQLWNVLMDLLEQLYALLGKQKITALRTAMLLEAGLEQVKLNSLPKINNAIPCGMLGSMPMNETKVVFVMGMNDGVLTAKEDAVLTPQEQGTLEEQFGVRLVSPTTHKEQLQKIELYKVVSSTTRNLYFSYAQSYQDGTALRPHSLVNHIRKILPGLILEGGATAPQGVIAPLALRPMLNGLGQQLRKKDEIDEKWKLAWNYVSVKHEKQAKAIQQMFHKDFVRATLPKSITKKIFKQRISSISRLETFAACPFKHFVQYGLKPKEQEVFAFENRMVGTFYHSALEGFTRILPTIDQWPNISKQMCDLVIDEAAQKVMGEVMGDIVNDSARAKATSKKYMRLLRNVAWTFTKTARVSAFTPAQAEVKFGFEEGLPPIVLSLDNGEKVLLRGVIDRVDRYDGEEVYLRVIDYKSGKKSLSPSQMYHGTQLQLMIYMLAALQQEQNILPAGAFYFHLADPIIEDVGTLTEVEEKLAKELKLKGVTLKDAQVIRLLDSGEPPVSMPSLIKADGGFRANQQLATLEEMHTLINHALTCAKKLAQSISQGEVDASPLKLKSELQACEYCAYASICRKNAEKGSIQERQGETFTFDGLLEALQAENSEQET